MKRRIVAVSLLLLLCSGCVAYVPDPYYNAAPYPYAYRTYPAYTYPYWWYYAPGPYYYNGYGWHGHHYGYGHYRGWHRH
jgi:hypothetical protein